MRKTMFRPKASARRTPGSRPAAIRLAALAVLGAGLGAVGGRCGGGSGGTGGQQLSPRAFSAAKGAFAGLDPGFNKAPGGKGVPFNQSYGASGDQSRAVD